MRYAYLGPPGTFTDAALRSMPLDETDETTPFTTVSAALDAVRDWRFEPARRDGVPLRACCIVPITFSLDD